MGRAAQRWPRPHYQRGEAAAGAGGASLGRRPRHVLDTGLSGLEPLHKGPGRRRNKGLFHAATEKPQISLRVLRRQGGTDCHPPRPFLHHIHSARVPGLGSLRRPELSPHLLLKIPLSSLVHIKPLNFAPCVFWHLTLPTSQL